MRGFILLVSIMLFAIVACDKKEPAQVVFKGTFLEVLDKATELVKVESNDAVLWEGDAIEIADSAMTADDINGWVFVFGIKEYTETAVIEYKDSTFSNVTIIPKPTFEDCLIKDMKMELTEAIDLMRKANYNDLFVAANLRWPLYPGCVEPYYIFGCPEIGHVFVGVQSKEVIVVPFR